jgi:hypothetical protein
LAIGAVVAQPAKANRAGKARQIDWVRNFIMRVEDRIFMTAS